MWEVRIKLRWLMIVDTFGDLAYTTDSSDGEHDCEVQLETL